MAGFRTFIPGLRIVLKTAHRYMTTHQNRLSASLTAPQYACLTDTIAAVASCLAILGTQEVEG